MMAESWRRLQEGKPEPHDITLKRRVHSMIKLKNIVKNNNKIKCDIYPEDSKIAGWLIVDTNSERTEYELPSGYEWCKSHITHARKALIQMNASQKLPKEKLIMWV